MSKHSKAQAEISELRKQRDEPLSALEGMLEQFNHNTMRGVVHDESAAIFKAHAAISNVVGGTKQSACRTSRQDVQ